MTSPAVPAAAIHIDIVTAVRDEEASLPGFLQAVHSLPLPAGVKLGVIFVEDSSRDRSVEVLRELARTHSGVGFFSLERGFGQGPAIVFGIRASTADAVIMLDADGSHPISAIPSMIDLHRTGARVVQCRRRSLVGRSLLRDAGSWSFHALMRTLTGVDTRQQDIYYRLVDAGIAQEMAANPLCWPWLRFALPSPASGELAFVEVDSVERMRGESKYGLRRLLVMAADGVLSLMPPTRRLVLSLALCVLGLGLLLRGAPLAGALLLAAVLALGVRFSRLRRGAALRQMRVRESSEAD